MNDLNTPVKVNPCTQTAIPLFLKWKSEIENNIAI